MKKNLHLLFLAIAFAITPALLAQRNHKAGDLDTGWGGKGWALIDPSFLSQAGPVAIAAGRDSVIYIVGNDRFRYTEKTYGAKFEIRRSFITRILANGTPDDFFAIRNGSNRL